MLRILHLVDMGQRYSRSKGVRERRLEEPPLGSLAVPCHLEESASHHLQLGALPLVEGGGAKHSPLLGRGRGYHLNIPELMSRSSISHQKSLKIMISENHQGPS